MKQSLARFFSLCSKKNKFQFKLLLVLAMFIAILQTLGIATVLPFLEIASQPDALANRPEIRAVFNRIGVTSESQIIIVFAWMALLLMLLANSLTVFSIWFQQKIAWTVSHNVSMRLVNAYGHLPYHFFLNKDTSDLIRAAIEDINKLIEGIVLAGCNLISQLFISTLIFALLVLVNPLISLIAFTSICTIYVLIVLARRTYLTRLGNESLSVTSDRYRTFVDFISGIKTIQSNGVREFFIDRFEGPSHRFSVIKPLTHITYHIPKYIVETLAFSIVIFIILLLARTPTGFIDALPTLTLFTIAGYKLIPAIQGAYVSFAQMLTSYPAVDNIYNDIHAVIDSPQGNDKQIAFAQKITLTSLEYTYPGATTPTLNGINMNIRKGSKVGFVGPSGSGKTTLADLIMGLLEPSAGTIKVDDTEIDPTTTGSWRRQIGYVPQEVFLYNDTVANNIAFGLPVDKQKVQTAARLAQIDTLIETQLPENYDSLIGERGTRLSGGQRQRLGLARALYRSPTVLVLDEATSALDSVTEGNFVKAIYEQLPDVTIIMVAHRISTVTRCDRLYAIDRGRVVAEGSYEQLIESSEMFRQLASFD